MTERYEKGLAVRRAVLGEEHVDRALASVDEFSRPMAELGVEYCWGSLWTRDGLPLKTRSLINIAMLAALNRPHEFKLHVRGALRNGCSKEEIREALLHVAIYCGIPAGSEAFRSAKEVFAEQPHP